MPYEIIIRAKHPAMKLYSANVLYRCDNDSIETKTGSKKSSLYFFKVIKLSMISAGDQEMARHMKKKNSRETPAAGYLLKYLPIEIKCPETIQQRSASVEKIPISDVDSGVKKQARQMHKHPNPTTRLTLLLSERKD